MSNVAVYHARNAFERPLTSGTQQVEMESVAALRDFFLARNRPELERAYGELTKNFPEDVPEVEDWEEVEFAFNQVFGQSGAVYPHKRPIWTETGPMNGSGD